MSAPDREKVIIQLEVDVKRAERTGEMLVYVGRKTAKDALTLLKEQEAVVPMNNYGTVRCGNCRNIVGYTDGHGRGYRKNFCSQCGKAVKWDD